MEINIDDIKKQAELEIKDEKFRKLVDEEKIKKICESMICIQPSGFEGLSLPPKEALWAGVPIILADVPVNREFHGDTVTYFEPDNIAELRQMIGKVPMNPEEGKKYIKRLTIEKATDEVEKWMKRQRRSSTRKWMRRPGRRNTVAILSAG